ncbi:LAFA_0F07052g1_1 [Lachancea sp. 'fantastica']|nr:LAFA_0F07052g1_1 [Lachancea sp. 'fantastica']
MKLTKLIGLISASFAIHSEFALAKWPDQSLYRFSSSVSKPQNIVVVNTTAECQDQTLSMMTSVLSYKVDIDVIEKYLLEGISVLKTLLNGKTQFNAMDLMDIATVQLHWFPPAGVDLSGVSLATQFSQMKTIYYSCPILRHTHEWILSIAKVSAQSSQWRTLSQSAIQVWTSLESNTPAVHSLFLEITRAVQAPETLKMLAKLKNEWTTSAPSCQKPKDAPANIKQGKKNAVKAAAMHAAGKVPSRVVGLTSPKPGNSPVFYQQRAAIISSTHANDTNHTAPVMIIDDESAAVASYRVQSWSIMGAVVLIISGAILF